MVNGDLKNLTDRELILLTAQEVQHIKVDQTEIREEFKSTNSTFYDIVSNCKSVHRQEMLVLENKVNNIEKFRDKVGGALIVISLLVTTAWGKILRLI